MTDFHFEWIKLHPLSLNLAGKKKSHISEKVMNRKRVSRMYTGWLLSLSSTTKRLVLIFLDIFAFIFSLWSGFALRYSDWWPEPQIVSAIPLFLMLPVISVIVLSRLRLYKAVVRHLDLNLLRLIAVGISIIVGITYAILYLPSFQNVPYSVPIIFGLCSLLYVGGSRVLIRIAYLKIGDNPPNRKRIVIYGSDAMGAQLAQMCRLNGAYAPIAFIDENENMWGREVSGLPVYPPARLPEIVSAKKIEVITLATNSASEQLRTQIFQMVTDLEGEVKSIPSLSEIISGTPISNMREIAIEDLLGRNTVEPVQSLLQESINGKNVCISGAGGSIGSELARQALGLQAKKILLIEQSEFALYKIERELLNIKVQGNLSTEIISVLLSVLEQTKLSRVLNAQKINTFYHAAAYKHVPLVERNILQGIENNVFGTSKAALAAEKSGVERFILISTDKAVRPTNVMGATKRVAELVLQDLATTQNSKMVCSIVRFGNVLDSSGSVVPLFREQIQKRSPITVTHPEVTRYFMTISEAATLVIQAGSLAEGGEVFVLDMGKPIKILDLAKTMVGLSGLKLQESDASSGDIAIEFTGLRPGEKLYEELLTSDEVQKTVHPKILRAFEGRLSRSKTMTALVSLRRAIEKDDPKQGLTLLSDIVRDYTPIPRAIKKEVAD